MTDVQGATPSSDTILGDSSWFPEALDAQNQTLHFVHTDRDTLSSRAFLSQSLWADRELPRHPLGLESVAARTAAKPAALNFIWHTAFCSSTALSRALDRPGTNLSIREPDALTTMARMRRGTRGSGASDVRRHLGALLHLLARPLIPGEQVTVKPANATNVLIRDAAALTTGKMLFLYSDCRSFLVAVASRGEARRAFIRRLFQELLLDGHEQKNWPKPRLFEMSDLQIAALVWHMQIAEFLRSRNVLGDRVASLDCDAFLGRPGETLAAVNSFLGLGLPDEHLRQVVSGPLLTTNAKNEEEPFDPDARLKPRELGPQLLRDLEEIVAWSYDVCRATPRGVPLPDPLIALTKDYLPLKKPMDG